MNKPSLAGICTFLLGAFFWLAGCTTVTLPPPEAIATLIPQPAVAPTPTAYPLPTRSIKQDGVWVEDTTPDPALQRQRRYRGSIHGEPVAETPHLRIYAEDGFLPVDLEWFQEEAETVYAYVSERLGTTSDRKFDVAFRPPDESACPVRGLARPHPDPQTIIYAGETTSRTQILGVLAHELGHLLHAHGLRVGGDIYLNEGLATWAAGTYFEQWQGSSLEESVRSYLQEGRYVPLHEYYRQEEGPQPIGAEDCLAERDRRYISWAAFLDWLIERYGMEKLLALLGPAQRPDDVPTPAPVLTIPPRRPGTPTARQSRIITERIEQPPDFAGVYGLALNAWLRQLAGQE